MRQAGSFTEVAARAVFARAFVIPHTTGEACNLRVKGCLSDASTGGETRDGEAEGCPRREEKIATVLRFFDRPLDGTFFFGELEGYRCCAS